MHEYQPVQRTDHVCAAAPSRVGDLLAVATFRSASEQREESLTDASPCINRGLAPDVVQRSPRADGKGIRQRRPSPVKELALDLPESQAPVYLRIMEAIRAAIESGRVASEERVPATRELARQLGASRNTVARALEELVAEGWLIARSRSGYYVSSRIPSDYVMRKRRASVDPVLPSPAFDWKSRVQSEIAPARDSEYTPLEESISFKACGPDVRMLPLGELRHCLRQALTESPAAVLGYGDTIGYGPFLEVTAAYLRRVCGITDRELIITNGSMEACFLVCQLLLGPGKAVAMEELCFFPIYQQFQLSGSDVIPLPLDESGLIPEALEELASQRVIDLLYLTPLYQYPTTATLQAARRTQIYEICARHGIPILEDNYDHEFHYRTQPPVPLAATDPLGLVIYLSTFSNSLFPSARLGYLAVPKPLYSPILQLRGAVTHNGGNFLQAALAHWIDEGGFERHIKRMRLEYAKRLQHLVGCLSDLAALEPSLRFPFPQGGLGLWVDTGRNASEVADRGRLHGVGVVPETACRISPDRGGNRLRLNFGCLTPQEITRGVELLGQTLHDLA